MRGGASSARSSDYFGKSVRVIGPVVVWLVAGFGVHVFVHQLNILTIGGFPAGYYLAAQAAPLVLASVCFWIALRRRRLALQRARSHNDAAIPDALAFGRWRELTRGARAAGAVFGGGMLVALTGAAFSQGYDGFAYLLGVMSAVVAVSVLYLPAFSLTGASSFSGQLMHRYGSRTVSVLGGMVAAVSLVLLLSAEILALGITLARMLAISARDGMLLGAAALVIVALGAFTVSRLLAVALALSILAVIAALCVSSGVASFAHYQVAVPQLGYGFALAEVTGLERHLLLDGLADPVSLKQHIRPRMHFDIVNFFAIAATIAVGFGALAASALVRQSRAYVAAEAAPTERLSCLSAAAAWFSFFACFVIVTVPAVATLSKVGLLQALSDQIPLSTLPTWIAPYVSAGQLTVCGETHLAIEALKGACNDPEKRLALQDLALAPDSVLLASSEFSGTMPGLTILVSVVICFAALVCGAVTVSTLGCEIRDSVYGLQSGDGPKMCATETQFNGISSGLSFALLAGLVAAGVLVALLSGLDALLLICVSSSLAAACMFPAIVLGAVWRRIGAVAAGASIVTGACVCAYYVIGTTYFADRFALTWTMISSAPAWQIEQLRSLQVMCAQADVGECAQLPSVAHEAANWMGIETAASALFALPASIVVLSLFALVAPPRAPHGGRVAVDD